MRVFLVFISGMVAEMGIVAFLHPLCNFAFSVSGTAIGIVLAGAIALFTNALGD